MKTNLNDFAKLMCDGEHGLEEVNIAQMKEILKVVAKIVYQDSDALIALLQYGKKVS
jgi:hypothetical protein